MRAIDLRSHHLRAALFAGAFGAVSLVACADALHLDPPGVGGGETSSTTTSSGTGGRDGGVHPVQCRSNPDCAWPKAICDTAQNECVECLVLSDCAHKAGTVCSLGECVCPNPDGSPSSLAYCAGQCVDTHTSKAHCGSCDTPCTDGTCVNGVCEVPDAGDSDGSAP